MSDARLNRQMLAELRAVMEDEFNLLLETFFAGYRAASGSHTGGAG